MKHIMYIVKLNLYLLIIVLCGCSHTNWIDGPQTFMPGDIDKITIISLNNKDKTPFTVSGYSEIQEVSPIFSQYNWQVNEDIQYKPHFKIVLFNKSAETKVYWLGFYSDQSISPCFKFCSGHWLMASDSNGNANSEIYKSLATSFDMLRVGLLFHNEIHNQDNSADLKNRAVGK